MNAKEKYDALCPSCKTQFRAMVGLANNAARHPEYPDMAIASDQQQERTKKTVSQCETCKGLGDT